MSIVFFSWQRTWDCDSIIEAKGSAREEYLLPLIREKDPSAVRSFKGRNGEGSSETGVPKYLCSSKDSRFVPVIGQDFDRDPIRGTIYCLNKGGTALIRPLPDIRWRVFLRKWAETWFTMQMHGIMQESIVNYGEQCDREDEVHEVLICAWGSE